MYVEEGIKPWNLRFTVPETVNRRFGGVEERLNLQEALWWILHPGNGGGCSRNVEKPSTKRESRANNGDMHDQEPFEEPWRSKMRWWRWPIVAVWSLAYLAWGQVLRIREKRGGAGPTEGE